MPVAKVRSAVAVVAVDEDTEVDHDERAALDLDVPRDRVRTAAVLGGSDDRREAAAVAEFAAQILDLVGDRALGAAGDAVIGKPGVDLVRELRGPPQQFDLLRGLDRAQVLEQHGRRPELRARGAELRPGRVRELVRLEPDRAAREA